MHWITFRFRHECPFSKLSAQHPTVPMANWCNFNLEILEFQARDPAHVDLIQRDLERLATRGFKPLRVSSRGGRAQTVLMRCGHKRGTSIDDVIEAHGCFVLYPLLYQGGWEHYRMVALDDSKVDPLFRTLSKEGTVEITSKRSMEEGMLSKSFVVSTNELFDGLTPKQASALVAAVEHGYYKVPRKTRFEDIAKARKVPRTTFEEHVRKAESKLITALAPFVALHASQDPQPKPRGE